MSQSGSSSSQMPPHVHAFGPKTVLIAAFICVALGAGWLWLANKINNQAQITEAQRADSVQLKQDVETQKGQTEKLAATVEEREQALQNKVRELRGDLETALSAVNTMQKEINSRNLALTLMSVNADQLVRRIEQTEAAIDSLRDQRTRWKNDSQQALTSDRGRLGSSPDVVQAFVDLNLNPIAADDAIQGWEDTLNKLKVALIPVRDGTTGEIADVPAGFATTISGIKSSVRAEADRLSAVQRTLTRVTGNNSSVPPNGPTLQQAVAQREVELKNQREATIEAAARRVRDEMTQVLAAERAKTEQVLADQRKEFELKYRDEELKKQKAEEEIRIQKLADATEDAKRTEAQRQASRQAEVKRQDDLRRLQAAMPDIRRYLLPFITPGNQQMDGTKWVFADDKVPMSFSAIKASGALANSQEGYQALYWIGGGQKNDRPKGVFRDYIGGAIYDDEVPKVRRVQQLLTEFGDLLVDQDMLSK